MIFSFALLLTLFSLSAHAALHDNTLLTEVAGDLSLVRHIGAGISLEDTKALLSLVCIDDQNLMEGSVLGCNRVRFAVANHPSTNRNEFVGPYIHIGGLSQKQIEKKLVTFLEDSHHVQRNFQWVWEKDTTSKTINVRNAWMSKGLFKNKGWNWSSKPKSVSRSQFYEIIDTIKREHSNRYAFSPYAIVEDLRYSMQKAADNSKNAAGFKSNGILLVSATNGLWIESRNGGALVDLQFWSRLSESEQIALHAAISFERSVYSRKQFRNFLSELGVQNADEIAKNAQEIQGEDHLERLFTRFK